jgi:2'-phosphotransferase
MEYMWNWIILCFGLLLITMELQLTVNHCLQTVVDPDLVSILHASEIPTIIHGTYFKNWTKIKTDGLSRMNRLHIHFSPGEPGDSQVISGMRSSCELYIYIDTEKAVRGKSLEQLTQ